jgi:hypothetical protein
VERDPQRRIAANEAAFRKVNDSIASGQWPGEEDAPVAFRCECARLGCNELLEISMREYEGVRAHPRRFLVLAGHEFPDMETIVQARPGYVVIEKREEAGRLAEALDPRD